MLTARQLCGLDARNAELMGKPHVAAFYARPEDHRSHRLEPGARCAVCGARATDAHHVVPRGRSAGFTVNTPLGRFVCLSPLFALCRECHEGFHARARYRAEWAWNGEEDREAWWSGGILAHGCPPNGAALWDRGRYVVRDADTGMAFEVGP